MIPEVFYFNEKILKMPRYGAPKELAPEEREWLIGALQEEIEEFKNADNIAEDVDALIDLVYFAIGGLCRLGLTEVQAMDCFNAVHRANMTKGRGIKPTRPQDGSVADAVKDESFVDPVGAIARILRS